MHESYSNLEGFFIFEYYLAFIGAMLTLYTYGKVNGAFARHELPFVRSHLKILFLNFLVESISVQINLQ